MTSKKSRSPSATSSVALEAQPDEQSQAAQTQASQPQPTQAQESDVDTDAASVTSKTSVASMVSHRSKKTKLHSSLTEEKEHNMVEWLEENPVSCFWILGAILASSSSNISGGILRKLKKDA